MSPPGRRDVGPRRHERDAHPLVGFLLFLVLSPGPWMLEVAGQERRAAFVTVVQTASFKGDIENLTPENMVKLRDRLALELESWQPGFESQSLSVEIASFTLELKLVIKAAGVRPDDKTNLEQRGVISNSLRELAVIPLTTRALEAWGIGKAEGGDHLVTLYVFPTPAEQPYIEEDVQSLEEKLTGPEILERLAVAGVDVSEITLLGPTAKFTDLLFEVSTFNQQSADSATLLMGKRFLYDDMFEGAEIPLMELKKLELTVEVLAPPSPPPNPPPSPPVPPSPFPPAPFTDINSIPGAIGFNPRQVVFPTSAFPSNVIPVSPAVGEGFTIEYIMQSSGQGTSPIRPPQVLA
eukprot:CAMPEP_0177755100 /NCGR_PEP_ID=MMETSP0491_2-20121128/2382_1 /TAXON_ID=63592 /ORGANISM="Tetraselmis chuii, Strain PLY429" /LENGTH=350 /DNA_ID=CAMNT_0019270567 /DNA_START=216 /DNA_END=1265 /DNA_ORIENTATION=+